MWGSPDEKQTVLVILERSFTPWHGEAWTALLNGSFFKSASNILSDVDVIYYISVKDDVLFPSEITKNKQISAKNSWATETQSKNEI